ncbi:unnamed protein product [Cylicocyclus nassatus]|uniref:Uncharacterized protein n=1 Tax=Cylicocyclus nassatus TaxID=53992 RepID=A0AA36H0X5_CYLNA|nr:unnamed protein product [Cylicocyclus nassatus]
MSEVFSEDDREYLNKFTNARNTNSVGTDVLEDIHNVLSNNEFSSNTRLAAAKLLLHAEHIHGKEAFIHHIKVDWIMLTAVLEAANEERSVKAIKTWMLLFERHKISDSDDEAVFLASLAKYLSKKGADVISLFTAEEAKKLRRYLLLVFVLLSELERGSKSFENAIHFVAKTMTEEEKVLDFCFDSLPLHLRGRYGLMRLLLRDNMDKYDVNLVTGKVCKQLTQCMDNQLITNAAADLIALLVTRLPASSELTLLFLDGLSHHVKCIRWNVYRWFGRINVSESSFHFFKNLRDSLRAEFSKVDDDVSWPPYIWEFEDFSCIDPLWNCDESEEVTWKVDRVLEAYLKVSGDLQQRFHEELDVDDAVIQAGLKWHLPDIRLEAFRIWFSCIKSSSEQDKYNHDLEDFILKNGLSSLASLRKAVATAAAFCKMSDGGKSGWMRILNILKQQSEADEQQRGASYLPDGVNVQELLPLPRPEQAKERLEEFLQLSGSKDLKSCPSFPDLYANLAEAGHDQRVFARYIIDLIDLIRSHEDVNTAVAAICEAVTRCRLKVVVDHGCTVIEGLLSHEHLEKHFFYLVEYTYCWAMNQLIDKKAQCRTLPLSRILWSTCEKSRDLMRIFFESCQSTLADSTLNANVHQRLLKTLKLFASKAECKMPPDFVEFTFWHCVDAQKHDDFLVRSASTILFGFMVRYITKSRVVPAFYIISTRSKFWQEIVHRCLSLSDLPSLQRILLLSFLTRLSLGYIECYSRTMLEGIHFLIVSVIKLLDHTKDIRERRFCLETLVVLSPTSACDEVLRHIKELNREEETYALRADCDFLEYTLEKKENCLYFAKCSKIPTDFVLSPHVQIIEDARMFDPQNAIAKIENTFASVESHSAELTLQALAMALTLVARNLRVNGHANNEELRIRFVKLCFAILNHGGCTSRAVSLLSRIPVVLGLTKYYMHKSYITQLLKQWEQGNA